MENQFICQSCGMPMNTDEDFGRNPDGSKNEEYCCYCLKDGVMRECSLNEMIEICAEIEVREGIFPDIEAARKNLSEYLPTLKRWKGSKA